jgi:4-hydroxybenzoate polyprenyltransferase
LVLELRPYLVLVRAGTLFSPAADILAGLCLAAGTGAVSWDGNVVRLIVASVLLYAGGMILNDHADRDLDAKQRPERPIPQGKITPVRALILGILCLAGCLFASPIPYYHGVMAALVLGYDYVIKKNVAAGAVTMGTLRGMNLLAPTAVAGLGNVWDTDSAIEAAAGYFFYIVAVTLLGVLEDEKHVHRRSVLGLISVPPIAGLLVIYSLPVTWPATGIAIALATFFLWRHRNIEWNQRTIRGAMMWLLLGTMLYTALIALGTGHWFVSPVIIAMLLTARVVAHRISLT